MKKPDQSPRTRDNHADTKAMLLAVVLGLTSVAGIGSVVLNKIEKVFNGPQVEEENLLDEVDSGGEADAEISNEVEIDSPRTEVTRILNETARWAEDFDLEAANALVYEVENECDIELPSPLDYDARSQDERETCLAMPEQSEFSLCVEDSTFCMVDNSESEIGTPLFHCEIYNHGSPREACLDEAISFTRDRAFYECRDHFLEDNGIQEEYHRAQVRIFDENMRYIKKLLDKLSADENYRPSSNELLEYFTAYHQLRNLRDFDVVMDQMDLGEKSDFVRIYGDEVKAQILQRGCSESELGKLI